MTTKKEDLFIQLQLEDASPEINALLSKFDLVLRVDEETNEYSCFAIENFDESYVATDYYPLAYFQPLLKRGD